MYPRLLLKLMKMVREYTEGFKMKLQLKLDFIALPL